MAHITFIHGIDNKPAPDRLLQIWRDALAANGGIDLAAAGVTTSMVYWADVLYDTPEAIEEAVAAVAPPDAELVQILGQAATESREEARFLSGLAGKFAVASMKSMTAMAASAQPAAIEERVPLPWSIKEPLMAKFLRDVHHYLFNTRFSPRDGAAYFVQDEIRRRFVEDLEKNSGGDGPHIVVSHSMGTVIAYDCLLRVGKCPAVDDLMTIGSPLGLDEIQDKMQPEWTRRNGFPQQKLKGRWVNVYDPLDPVAGFDPNLADDYERNGRPAVTDINESNSGWWRHNISKYLGGAALRNALRTMLNLPTVETPSLELPAAAGVAPQSMRWVSAALVETALSHAVSQIAQATKTEAVVGIGPGPALDDRIGGAVRALTDETAQEGAGVMTSPPHQLASLLQSAVQQVVDRRAAAVGLEFPFDGPDVKQGVADALKQADRKYKHPQLRPQNAKPAKMPDDARVFLVSDFGTGLYGAPVIARTVLSGPKFHLLMHLGDIYYSGQPEEVHSRFLDVWPSAAGKISRNLNGNHDMYSGGYGYFDVALPAFDQTSSYFAFQNKHWLLVALDTAYRDNDLGKQQRRWLDEVVDRAGSRRLILFSHHPLFSNFKEPGEKLEQRLRDLLEERRVTAWYWGHEHHAVIYQAHEEYGLLGRCLGNGGMPNKRDKIADFPVVRSVDGCVWRRYDGDAAPPAEYLDGPNKFITDDPDKYGVHGYMTLEFDGPAVHETVYTATGTKVFENRIT